MLGQGGEHQQALPSPIALPSLSSTWRIPGSGRVAQPGLVAVRPGSGEIMIAPVSVCHQVSTTGHRSPPMTSWYHSQALGLIGSPTVPSRRRLDRSCLLGSSPPSSCRPGSPSARCRTASPCSARRSPTRRPMRVVGRTLVHHARRPVDHRPVDDVAVPGDPADVGGHQNTSLSAQVEHLRGRRADP